MNDDCKDLNALIIDDDSESINEIVDTFILLKHGFDVARSLEEARLRLASNTYSYILLDIFIPVQFQGTYVRMQNGVKLLSEIRRNKSHADVPVIVMNEHSAVTSQLAVEMMRVAAVMDRKGPVDFISKPLPSNGRTLCYVIRKMLGIRSSCQVKHRMVSNNESLPADTNNDTKLLTVSEAGELLMDVRDGIDLNKARARVSKAARVGKFKTNGMTGCSRRIEKDSFNTWLFEQREKELALAG